MRYKSGDRPLSSSTLIAFSSHSAIAPQASKAESKCIQELKKLSQDKFACEAEGKATDRPTLRWIFQRFQCIHLVEFNNEKHVSNWTPDRDFILNLLPDDCLRYYQLVT